MLARVLLKTLVEVEHVSSMDMIIIFLSNISMRTRVIHLSKQLHSKTLLFNVQGYIIHVLITR